MNKHTEAVTRSHLRYPEKRDAARKVASALKAGKLTRSKLCEDCYDRDSEHAHHEDYSKPLDVIWLCSRCHKARHKGKMKYSSEPPMITMSDVKRLKRDSIRRRSALVKRIMLETDRRLLTKKELSDMSGLSQEVISGLFRGRHLGPKTIRALMSALNMDEA